MAGGAPAVVLSTLTGTDALANPLPAVPTGKNVRTLLAPHLQTGIFDPRTFGETTISPHFSPDRVHQWSLGVQQQISQNGAFEVRYVGNHAQNLFQTINGNPYILGLANLYPQLVPAGLTPCPASQAAIPELTGRVNCTGAALIRERGNTGYSDYHGLQTEFRSSHLWNQLTLKSAYTLSKTTDNASEIGATLAAGGTFAISQSPVNFTESGTQSLRNRFSAKLGFDGARRFAVLSPPVRFPGSRPRRLESLGRIFTTLGPTVHSSSIGTQLRERRRRVRRNSRCRKSI